MGSGRDEIRIWDFIRIHLQRNRKKNGWVILSLTTTGVLFVTVSSVIKSMNLENMLNMSIRGDYSLELSEKEARDKKSAVCLEPELILQIKNHKGVTGVHTMMYERFVWDPRDAQKYTNITEEFEELGIGYEDIDSVIYGYDDSFVEACLQQLDHGELTLKEMRENNHVIAIQNGNSNFKVNDTIRLKNNGAEGGTTEFKIVGILEDNITYRGYSGAGNDLIIHQNRFEVLHMDQRIQRASITVEEDEKEAVKKYLDQLVDENEYLELKSQDELMEEYSEQKKALATSSYSLLALLFCISIINLLNTSLSSILSQKRELGMLEAIGLTKQQENKIFQIQGMVLVLISGTLAAVLGIPLGYAGFCLFARSASYAVYKVPAGEVILLLICFIIVEAAVTKTAVLRLSKDSIIEKINNEDM